MRLILRLLANASALAVATWLLSGITLTADTMAKKVFALLVVALIFGVLNAVIKPIFRLVTLPIVLHVQPRPLAEVLARPVETLRAIRERAPLVGATPS